MFFKVQLKINVLTRQWRWKIGGGQVNHEAANNANTALYTTFAFFSVLDGSIYNVLGPRLTLLAGCSTYVLYTGSFLYYNHYQHQLFTIIVGAILSVGAGLLWAGQGAIMTLYPPAGHILIFWSIFNMGGIIGVLIPFSLNYNRTTAASMNDGTYIGFMVFMSIGIVLYLAIPPLRQVICNDGLRATNVRYSSVGTKSMEILKLFMNWKMLLMVPASWASNFFYRRTKMVLVLTA
ncbi:hypothetical protein J5N97_010568 [Dioscorea zingiberensis]|uniref:UNC93-like protein n=1 Tax=Dioscorea zingiberensis TaxID=325984 RepID=A0A9D5D1F1_9LILI|nr:hypothetical protein J5N97_010568 [Dioscorea zingiberensis]